MALEVLLVLLVVGVGIGVALMAFIDSCIEVLRNRRKGWKL